MAKKNISPEMKLKIVLEAIKEERHIGAIAAEHVFSATKKSIVWHFNFR